MLWLPAVADIAETSVVPLAESLLDDDARRALSITLVAQNKVHLALSVARQIQHEWSRSRALAAVGQGLGQSGSAQAGEVLAEALAAARQIQHEWSRSSALAAVGQALAAAGQLRSALEAANEIRQNTQAHYGTMADTIVRLRGKEGLKLFLPTLSQFMGSAWIMVGGLAHTYPEQAPAILEAIRRVAPDPA